MTWSVFQVFLDVCAACMLQVILFLIRLVCNQTRPFCFNLGQLVST